MAGSVISTNYVSLVTQNYLSKSYGALGKAIERLSSGYRINSAMDDAAGQAIAARFTAQINGLAQASQNANDGISIAQTTEGAVNETNNSVQRIRELVVQGLNGSNSQSDLQSLQDEIFQRLQEINRVSDQTQFNGVYVLKQGASLAVQVGYNDGEKITINLRELTAKTLGLQGFTLAGPQATTAAAAQADYDKAFGAIPSITVNDVKEGTANALAGRLGLANGSVKFDAVAQVDPTTGTWFARAVVTPANAAEVAALKARGFDGTATTAANYYIALNPKEAVITSAGTPPVGTATFTIDTTNMSLTRLNLAAMANPLQKLDLALQKISEVRSELGATMSRFESTVATLDNTVTNLSNARSRIQDTDYAVEVSNMTKAQILQQAGTSALAQANQVPQLVLALLR